MATIVLTIVGGLFALFALLCLGVVVFNEDIRESRRGGDALRHAGILAILGAICLGNAWTRYDQPAEAAESEAPAQAPEATHAATGS